MEDKTRNIKLTKVVYNTTSKQLLAKSEDFVFTFDCVKAMTLYWNIIKDKPDMTAAVESLLVIEEPTQVSRMHCRHEFEHYQGIAYVRGPRLVILADVVA